MAGERMGGAPAVATIHEADINEAIISGFDGIETVDCAGSSTGSVKGGVLIFRTNADGDLRRLLLYCAIPISVGRIRLSGLDIYLRPTEGAVAKTWVVVSDDALRLSFQPCKESENAGRAECCRCAQPA